MKRETFLKTLVGGAALLGLSVSLAFASADDAIKGRIEVPNAELEDLVLVTEDGDNLVTSVSP